MKIAKFNKPNAEDLLINSPTEPTEKLYPDFVLPIEFINRTGVFVSLTYFPEIYKKFKESGVTADEFIRDYEKKYAESLCSKPMTGKFKYELDDYVSCFGEFENDYHEANVLEALYSVCELAEYRKKKYEADMEERKQIEKKFMEKLSATLEGMSMGLKDIQTELEN